MDEERKNSNVELVEKALDSLSFADGGTLNAQQQKNFIKYVKKFSTMLGVCRVVRMKNPAIDIDKLWINRPITRAHGEWTTASADPATLVSNQVQLISAKTKSYWYITTEALQSNIEQDRLESDVQMMLIEQIATDFENLLINGDVTTYAADNTDTGWLLRRANGILNLAEGSHIHSFGGQTIGRSIFREMRKMIPQQYLKTKGMSFFIPDSLWVDFADSLADRGTGVGDAALLGNVISPYGYPITKVELMPDNIDLDVTNSTSAIVYGTAFGPFAVGAGNAVTLDIDNQGTVALVLTDDTLNAVAVANQINAAIYADAAYIALDEHELYRHVARDDGMGRLVIESPTTGAASEVDVEAVANDAYTLLGLTVAAVTGAAAGAHKTVAEGGSVLLTHPNNIIFGILDGTRIFARYNPDLDGIETFVYNQVAINIENLDGMCYGVDVRVRE